MKYALLIQLLAAISAPPGGLQNAKVTARPVGTGGLAAEVRAAAAARGASWIGYLQAVVGGPRQMCCFGDSSGTFSGHSKTCCGGCRLEEEKSFSIGRNDAAPVSLESPRQFRVLLRVEKGVGPTAELRVLGDRTQRVGGIRAFYDCLRTSLPEDSRAAVPAKLSDDDLLAWRLANSIVANPAGEYEVVARYLAREAGFWHEPVLSKPVRFRIVSKAPCPSPSPK